jgi:UDP-N-acetylmuramoylalanine--D-glutamate ligase
MKRFAFEAYRHRIINDIELFFRTCKKPAICVTGTNGKSTVVALLEHILKHCNFNAVACGNYGLPILEAYMMKPDLYVVELSSYQLENAESIECISSVVLNVGVDHVERYQDMAEYQDVKESIYKNARLKVIPVNQGRTKSFGKDIIGYRCNLDDESSSNTEYSVKDNNIYFGDELLLDTASLLLHGQHNALNVCAALALCEPLKLPKAQVLGAIRTFPGLPHRMEFVCKDSSGTTWINDSKSTNVHSLHAALESSQGNLCLIAGGYGKGEDYSEVFAAYRSKIEYLVLFGKEAENMYQQAVAVPNKVVVKNVAEAVNKAICNEQDIHTVLFSPACASFDLYRDYIERGDDFRSIVREACSC